MTAYNFEASILGLTRILLFLPIQRTARNRLYRGFLEKLIMLYIHGILPSSTSAFDNTNDLRQLRATSTMDTTLRFLGTSLCTKFTESTVDSKRIVSIIWKILFLNLPIPRNFPLGCGPCVGRLVTGGCVGGWVGGCVGGFPLQVGLQLFWHSLATVGLIVQCPFSAQAAQSP